MVPLEENLTAVMWVRAGGRNITFLMENNMRSV
jgi:hypothetical protein